MNMVLNSIQVVEGVAGQDGRKKMIITAPVKVEKVYQADEGILLAEEAVQIGAIIHRQAGEALRVAEEVVIPDAGDLELCLVKK